MKKSWKITLVFASAAVLSGMSIFIPLDSNDFREERIQSVKILDRNGLLLREFLNDEQGRGDWVPLTEIAPAVIASTIAVEDKRFYRHPGIDPLAIARAVYHNIFFGEHFGGSTLSQQVIRNIYHHPRTFLSKSIEAWCALRLERMMTKDKILEQYLNRAPYGNQLFGIQAASRYYFDKPAKELSIAEAAFLSGLPNSPTFLNPYQNHRAASDRQKIILRRMMEQHKISEEEFRRAMLQPIPVVLPEKKLKAPHAVEMIHDGFKNTPGISIVSSTLDFHLQQDAEWIVKGHLDQLKDKNVTNAAVVVVDNSTGEIRALVGSANYFDDSISGKVNGTTALRQPGSSLKPFMYGAALESGFTPATMLADIPTSLPSEGGDYVPENYDREYHGPVRLRTALACSYNIPAVRVLNEIGKEQLYDRLQRAGISSLNHPASYYGYGLTLGNAEVSLIELTNAYRAIANNGLWTPMHLHSSVIMADGKSGTLGKLPVEDGDSHPLFPEEIAFLLTDILSDHSARRPAFGNHFNFGFHCAVKTGTTKDYKDNWTLGFTSEYTVGVWVGNFNGEPMRMVSGVSGAGQIFTDIMNLLASKNPGTVMKINHIPSSIVRKRVCALSGMLPGLYCRNLIDELFVRGNVPRMKCVVHKAFYVNDDRGEPMRKIFELLPPEYSSWAAMVSLPQPPMSATPAEEDHQNTGKRKRLIITYPHNGDVFKIDPSLRREYQTIKIDMIAPSLLSQLSLCVNGSKMPVSNSKDLWWQLKKGKYAFTIEGEMNNKRLASNRVNIFVE